jgi:chaperonin GroEL
MKVHTNNPGDPIMSALEQLFAVVAPTYGPNGRGVLIDREFYQEIVDDGFNIINEFELPDEVENAVIKYVREASRKTNSRAGDGTTTSFLILIAILREVYGPNSKYILDSQRRGVTASMRKAVKVVVDKLRADARSIDTEEDLYAVAKNSYANEDIARLIARAVFSVGKDGTVTVEASDSLETKAKVVTGMQLDRGFINPYMAQHTSEGVMELMNPLIVVTDSFINAVKQLQPTLELSIAGGEKRDVLFICDDLTGEALNVLVVNHLRGALNTAAIKNPGFGDSKLETLKDIALVTGATVLSEKLGRAFSTLTEADLGSAKKVIITKDSTIIVDGAGDQKKVDAHVETLKATKTEGNFEKKQLEGRISKLAGGVAVVQVGAPTESEVKTTKAKVEDAVNATVLAFKEGVIDGGGKAFSGFNTDSEVLNVALRFPREQLEANGKEALSGDAIDPVGVVVAALESAVSVAGSLIDCGGVIAPKIEKKDDK